MIHSLAGGSIRDISFLDFAKVEILEGVQKGSWFWYITDIPNLKAQDEVFVPLGATNQRTRGKVLRIDYSVSAQNAPIPIKRAKKVLSKA